MIIAKPRTPSAVMLSEAVQLKAGFKPIVVAMRLYLNGKGHNAGRSS